MNSLRLLSSNSDVSLEFSDLDKDHDFRVKITAHDHSADRDVYMIPGEGGFAPLFAEAAAEWTGWAGTKAWENGVGTLILRLSMDKLGHVNLTVIVRSDQSPANEWELQTNLSLDAGQLGQLARDAARFWGEPAPT